MLTGGATFACLLMLKHLFLSLAPLYFVHLLRHYCFEGRTPPRPRAPTEDVEPHDSDGSGFSSGELSGGGNSKGKVSARGTHPNRQRRGLRFASRSPGEAAEAAQPQLQGEQAGRFSWKRLVSLGGVVLSVFLSALGPQCVSDGWTKEACVRQLNQLAVRLFPFGRSVFRFWTLYVVPGSLVLHV